jgi:quercetin dioxygenase-like cupin family protein
MQRIGSLFLSFLLAGCATSAAHIQIAPLPASSEAGSNAVMIPASTIPVFAPFRVPAESNEVLVGNASTHNRPFVFRIRELPGTVIPPHTHPIDENITVLHGTFYFGIGRRFDPDALHVLPAGSFIFVPHGTPMFGYAPEAVVVQIHGVGVFKQPFIDPPYTLTAAASADPDLGSLGMDQRRFRFHEGDAVTSPRGSGKIKEGFSFGTLTEYIVVGADGHLFMAQEHEMQPTIPK